MKTPIEFDYDLWTEDGRYMVRVKRTGEVCEVDQDTMRMLRAEEKRLRRSMRGAPVTGSDETRTVLSLDYVSENESEGMISAWLEDPRDFTCDFEYEAVVNEFRNLLTPNQEEVFSACILNEMTCKEYAQKKGIRSQSVQETIRYIKKKAEKFFKKF